MAAILSCSFAFALPNDENVPDPFSDFEPENGDLYGWDDEDGEGWTEYSDESEWNLAENADFEDLDATGWATGWTIGSLAENPDVTGFSIDDQGFSGEHSAKLVSYSANVAYIEQTIAIIPDTRYRVSCWIKAEEIPEGVIGAHIAFPDAEQITQEYKDTQGRWEYAEMYLDVGHEIYEVTLQLRLGGHSTLTAGTAWFDNVEFEMADDIPSGAIYGQIGEVDEWDEGTEAGAETIPHVSTTVFFSLLGALLMYLFYRLSNKKRELGDEKASVYLKTLFAAAVVARVAVSFLFKGHPIDITDFKYWSDAVFANGPMNFYTAGFFADYPPGYMAVLYAVGFFKNVFSIGTDTQLFSAFVRLPAITADVASAYLVYRMAKRKGNTFALCMAAAAALCFTFVFLSAGWGQIDSILTFFILLAIESFASDKLYSASAYYIIAVLMKPQALMFGPLFLAALVAKIIDAEDKRKALKQLGISLLIMLGIAALVILPFTGSQDIFWVVDKYVGTATQYSYATINAFNLFGLLGGNWVNAADPLVLGISYGALGTIMLFAVVAYCCYLYFKSRKKDGSLLLVSAVMIAGIFMFVQFMHERYIFPSLLLVLAAYVKIRDRRLFFAFIAMSAATLFNVGMVYAVASQTQLQIAGAFQAVIKVGAFVQLVSVLYLGYSARDILLHGRTHEPEILEPGYTAAPLTLEPADNKLHMTKRDYLYIFALTAVYAVIALVNLGSLQAPKTYWRAEGDTQAAVANFGENRYVAQMRVFAGIGTGKASAIFHLDGAETADTIDYRQTLDEMYRWQVINLDRQMSGVTLQSVSGDLWIYEIAFFDENGNQIPVAMTSSIDYPEEFETIPVLDDPSSSPLHVFDEPDMIPATPGYFNGMYFDELYHGRTAFEHLNGLDPYENSHPPLGKIFIMLGIAVFGMNAFGWRIVGALFGIGMVPLIYVFAKRLFKKPELALFAAGMFTFDFMHFTQTRIATIDTYGVFFIILMYYYMYQYYKMSFFADGLVKTLKPLGLCGLFFALGCASKWICIYAGGGLAVLFAASLGMRYREYKHALQNAETEPKTFARAASFKSDLIKTLLFAFVFFIIVPLTVYIASYLPYMLNTVNPYDLNGVWGVQEYMFNYHSTLTETHPFQSSWWSWPIDLRPIWYYIGGTGSPETVSTISAFGNPAVWWGSFAGVIALVVLCVKRRIKINAETTVIFVALASQFLPWAFITRATFIYHYFASVPFIIFALTYVLGYWEERSAKRKWVKYALLGATVVLFAMFYPAISGAPMSRDYGQLLKWFPTWSLF